MPDSVLLATQYHLEQILQAGTVLVIVSGSPKAQMIDTVLPSEYSILFVHANIMDTNHPMTYTRNFALRPLGKKISRIRNEQTV